MAWTQAPTGANRLRPESHSLNHKKLQTQKGAAHEANAQSPGQLLRGKASLLRIGNPALAYLSICIRPYV